MKKKSYYIYTDGSFNNRTQLGVMGFMIFDNSQEHESEEISSALIQTYTIKEESNIRVELQSALLALEHIENCVVDSNRPENQYGNINLYTDCATIMNLSKRREKLETSQFITKSKNEPLKNADLYRRFFKLYDKLLPAIHWIRGHSPKRKKDFIERNFSFLDKLVRKKLRQI